MLLGGKKEDPGILRSFKERELASNAMYPYDVTGARDFWLHHYGFQLCLQDHWEVYRRRKGEYPDVECCPSIPLCPGTHHLFLDFLLSWVRLPDPLQSSSHYDLVGVGVRFSPGTFLRGRDYFLINSNSVLLLLFILGVGFIVFVFVWCEF